MLHWHTNDPHVSVLDVKAAVVSGIYAGFFCFLPEVIIWDQIDEKREQSMQEEHHVFQQMGGEFFRF